MLVEVLRKKNEYNISKVYTMLTWPDFDWLEPWENSVDILFVYLCSIHYFMF